MNLWTATPESVDVDIPEVVNTGVSPFTVVVAQGRSPVEGALVCARMDTLAYAWAYTDELGEADFELDLPEEGFLELTVTGMNLLPVEDSIVVASAIQPNVLYLRHFVVDSVYGNGNGLAEIGERIEVPVWVRNFGGLAASDVTGTIRTGDEHVTVLDSLAPFGDISPGDSALSAPGFEIRIGPGAENGHVAEISLVSFEAAGDSWPSTFNLQICAPLLVLDSLALEDWNGDPNGFLDPGESANLLFWATNEGASTADSLSVLFRAESPYVEILDSTAFFGDVLPGGEVSNPLDSLLLSVADSTPDGEEVTCALLLTSGGVYSDSFGFELMVGGREFLVYDLDFEKESGPVIAEALNDAGYIGYYTEDLDYHRDRLCNFQSLFISLGNPSPVLSEADGDAIQDYLEAGGNVYMEGVTAWDWGEDPPHPVYDMFGGEWGYVYQAWNPYIVTGAPYGIAHGMMFDYLGDEAHYDGLYGVTPYARYFLRASTVSSPFYAACINDPGTYKTVSSSLEIGKFIDDDPPNTKAVLLDTIMHFFGIHVDVEEEGSAGGLVYRLDPLRPNPSRGRVSVRYSLDRCGPISLSVYDVSGRQVRTLLSGTSDPGTYVIDWDGRDVRGARLSRGVYFVRLRSGSRVRVRKLVMMR
jgi:hypothetical protein